MLNLIALIHRESVEAETFKAWLAGIPMTWLTPQGA